MFNIARGRINTWQVLGAVIFMIFQVVATLYIPNITSDIVNKGVITGDTNYIVHAGIKMVIVSLITVVVAFGNVLMASQASQGLGRKLRSDLFKKILNFTHDEFDKFETASLTTRTTNDVVQIQNVMIMMLRMMIMAPIMLIGASFMAYQKNAEMTKIFLISIPILIIVTGLVMYFAVPLFKAMQKKTDRLNLVFREGLTGVRVIRAFRQDQFEQDRFKDANADYTNNAVKVFTIVAIMFPVVTLVMSGTNVGITWLGAHYIANQSMEIGNMIAFMTYAMQILMSFMILSMVFVFVPRASASAARIQEVFETKSEIDVVAKPAKVSDEASLSFNDVNFRYSGAEKLALADLNFKVTKGQTLAIIGGTGSGKSSLINLIPRFYDAETGVVSLNGTDVKALSTEDINSKVSMVPQKAFLFKGTIRDNMIYGKPDVTDDEIWHALEIAQAADFVKDLDGQLDGEVEQAGDNFSGGQKQRLAIARALVKDASVYVFDDSFSALDFKTDLNLRTALKNDEKISQAVVVIVGQRISTVADADQIVVLEDGKMVGLGTHQELKANNKTYQEIIDSQLKEGK
ncbi:multidrug resistance ABC superfamily ATP binding cassette transporter, ABC membrane protein [Companilactobacillus mindensis DSM 14500]|uniref:Multidrug resistance ABC superfamily ATP binding cassette transporter, ABC membrane protein n=1 Tax=Companilactobacillus mindensis DSM 14500 TaxID=1423770 RepID=A0A0R1QIH2_9LACO|nr:ABC transporter ATP-binding protein [Companilactobacillus mindensis]KRL44589.1 multidrug resistance ABC superfamily ATP binding cassette transporter, ABC membrane protein [Companilactobacillus mindensis DSM 14500]GEO78233.1 multidrug ABC transporter ATP-binding protein [Companilactobacillus mindensis]